MIRVLFSCVYECAAATERTTGRYTDAHTSDSSDNIRLHTLCLFVLTTLVTLELECSEHELWARTTSVDMFHVHACVRRDALWSSFLLRFFAFNGLIVLNVFVVHKA